MSKLIRDGYAEIIDEDKIIRVSDEVALEYAIEKIEEELIELKASKFEDIYEFADLIEVLYTVARLKGFDQKDVAKAIYKKNSDKGSFFNNLILEN
jgi:predicted house-cleaning noncanonical NTP pyrophosphatase (MazG superfamily)